MIRLDGVSGSTDATVDLNTGKAQVTIQKADPVTIVQDLHKGKNSGAAWKLLIDVSAVVILALSLVGYVLFFSLRFRLRMALILTGLSAAVLVGLFVFFVP